MKLSKFVFAGLALALAAPAALAAQAPDGAWVIEPRAGAIVYDDASAIETAAAFGLAARYAITPRLRIGPTLDYALTQTDGAFFVAVVPLGPDSSRVYQVGQNISTLNYGAEVELDLMPGSRFGPFVSAGGGGYRIYLDAQANEEPERVDGAMVQAGGGLRISLTESAGLRLEAHDMIYLDYDRSELDPRDPRLVNCGPPPATQCFPGANADLPDASSTIHNLRFSLGFTYVPGQGQ